MHPIDHPANPFPKTQWRFRSDDDGRDASDSDAEQLALLGVVRVYRTAVPDLHRPDTARLAFGQRFLPDDPARRDGVARLSRQAVESALWEFLEDAARLAAQRHALLGRLRFDAARPYEVLCDDERALYVFVSLAPLPAQTEVRT